MRDYKFLTPEHLVLTNNTGFVKAKDIKINDEIFTIDENYNTIKSKIIKCSKLIP